MLRNTVSADVMRPCCRWFKSFCLVASISVASFSVCAAPFDYNADIYGGLTYTSNVVLAPDGAEDDEVVFEVSPRISATRDGKRLDVDFDYRLQGLFYAREDRRNEVYNYLQSNLQSIVAPEFLFFDAAASISQTVIDPQVNSGYSSISVSGNSAEVITVSASPYLLRQIGPYTQFQAGYRAGVVEYDSSELVDNTEQDIFASLVNQGGDSPLNWRADFNSTTVDYDIDQEIELIRISGEIGFRISPRTEVVVSGGEDNNDFGSLPGTRVADGSFWDAGLRGGIGNNIEYDFRAGEQFFGDSYSASFRRSSPLLQTELSYTEAATTVGAQQLDYSNALSLLSGIGDIQQIGDITGFDLPQSDPELYIRKRLHLGNTFSRAKSTFRNRIYYEDRTYIRTELAGAKENVLGAQLEWSWQYDDATTIDSAINYQRLDSRDGVSQPEDLRLSVAANRAILDSSYILVRGWVNSRSATGAAAEYEEYAITVGFGRRY